MADIGFYKYLEAAFKYRLRDPKGITATLNTKFSYLGYNLSYDRIFYHARKILPEFYRTKFPNTEEGNLEMAKTVLQKLEKHQDKELENQFKGLNPSRESQQIIEEAKADSQAAAVQQPVAAGVSAGSTGGIPSLPTAGSVYQSPRTGIIQPPPSHPTPTPVTDKAERLAAGKGTAVTDKAEKLTYADQKSPVIDKAERLRQSSPAKTESVTPPTGQPAIKTTPFSKATPPPPPTKPNIASSRRINFPAFKPSASSINAVKNITSPAGIFFKRNSGRIVGGLGEMAKGVGRGVLSPAASSAYRVLGRAGNGGINTFARLTNQVGRRGLLSKGATKKNALRKWLIRILIGLLFFGFFAAITGLPGGGGPPGGGGTSPGSATDIISCKFTRADKSQSIKSPILAAWIVNAAAAAGIPSQVLASVAMHESQDFVANADDNHDAIKSGEYCNPGSPVCVNMTINDTAHPGECTATELNGNFKTARGQGLMQFLDIYNQNKGDLCNIQNSLKLAAEKLKNDGVTSQPTQDQVITAINHYYNSCTYGKDPEFSYCGEVWKDLQNCQTVSSGTGTPPVVTAGHSCVASATFVNFPGYNNIKPGEYSYVCGHCTPIFNAIDAGVNSAGGTAVFAVVDGKTRDDSNPVGGTALWLTGDDGQNYYYAHLQKGSLVIGPVKAGQQIGTIASSADTSSGNNGIAHVHFSAGTPGNRQSFSDPANIPAGPLLDTWCGNNVCNGKPNAAYSCQPSG